jgi:AraC family transcriptional regulator
MRVSVEALGPAREPQMRVYRQQMLAMVLQPGWVEVGWQRSQLTRHDYVAGEVILPRRHVQTWARTDTLHYLSIGIADAVLRAVCDGTASAVELRDAPKLDDRRLVGLVAAVNAERIAGFPSGRLFLDSVEQALAVTLVNNHAVRNHDVRVYPGGLGPARMRRIREFVHAAIEDELSLDQMAETVGLSRAHFWQMFRKSTGETPHHFVLRHRVERAKEMLRASEARVLDVAVACGFKTQQHFARIFRQICGTSPTEYRREWLGQKRHMI